VGLIQRIIEEGGIPTISITLSREISAKVRPPRSIYPGFPLGHPMGRRDNARQQRAVLKAALGQLREIRVPGTIVELSF